MPPDLAVSTPVSPRQADKPPHKEQSSSIRTGQVNETVYGRTYTPEQRKLERRNGHPGSGKEYRFYPKVPLEKETMGADQRGTISQAMPTCRSFESQEPARAIHAVSDLRRRPRPSSRDYRNTVSKATSVSVWTMVRPCLLRRSGTDQKSGVIEPQCETKSFTNRGGIHLDMLELVSNDIEIIGFGSRTCKLQVLFAFMSPELIYPFLYP
jgi:hypothetical protein